MGIIVSYEIKKSKPILTKASLVVMSNLSDAQEMMNKGITLWANNYINFAKYVVLQCKGDLTQEINPKTLWRTFAKTRFYKS